MLLVCSGSCHFWICRLIHVVSLGKIFESGLCLMAVLCLGKPQEEAVGRLLELRLQIRCQCCFYGMLNIYNRSR